MMQRNDEHKIDVLFRKAVHNSLENDLKVDLTNRIMQHIETATQKKEKLNERLSTLYASLGGVLIIALSYFVFTYLFPETFSFGHLWENLSLETYSLDFPNHSILNNFSFQMTDTLKFSIYIAVISLVLLFADMIFRKRYFNRHKTE